MAFLTITSMFLQVKNVLAGSLPENHGKYLLVEVPDGERNSDFVVVEKENETRSLIKVDTEENNEKKVKEKTECSGEGLGQCPKEHYCWMPPDGATIGECTFLPALQEICINKTCSTTEECEMFRDQEPRTGCLWDVCRYGRCHPYTY